MLVTLYFVTTHYSFAQQELGTIKGVVMDSSTRELLPGASVVIKGTTKGIYTDFDGNYEIKVSPGTYLLVVSFTGYKGSEKQVTVKANQTSTVNIEMTPGNQLYEIVISVQVRGSNSRH